MKKKNKALRIVLLCVGGFLVTILTTVGAFLIFASATTLKAESKMKVEISGASSQELKTTDTVKILTWNIGYGALDKDADFFMDGGTKVRAENKEKVLDNLSSIKHVVQDINPDIFMLQEVDFNSDRSYRVNEFNNIIETFNEETYQNASALNYKAGYVPYPFPTTIGKVESGIATFSKYQITDSERIQLPIPFSWPISLLNLKRCLLVNHIKIDGSDKELVMINLHLEAYDDGEGKIKQFNQLKEIMNQEVEKGNYVIAGGDFNQTFSNVDRTNYPEYEGNWVCPVIDIDTDFNYLMDETNPTCRLLDKPYKGDTNHQYYMIDGFITSKNIIIENIQTIEKGFENSDHNPVALSVKFN